MCTHPHQVNQFAQSLDVESAGYCEDDIAVTVGCIFNIGLLPCTALQLSVQPQDADFMGPEGSRQWLNLANGEKLGNEAY
jgi:hypothetical protein